MIWRILIGAGAGFLFNLFFVAVDQIDTLMFSVEFWRTNGVVWHRVAPIVVGGLMGLAWHKLKQET